MKKYFTVIALLLSFCAISQNDRYNDYNSINWVQTNNTISLNKKWSLHLEYQWRRDEGLKNWQQSLLRVGANYKLNENITAHLGYGWIETFSYGDYPIANNGVFPEHRIYEQLNLLQPVNKFLLTHRFRIEQRWLGRVKAGITGNREIEDWFFLHRFRYQFRMQHPFYTKGDKQLYGAAADEIFIGAGKNLGTNIFDQNRIFILAGYRFNKKLAIEGGYLNQTLQQGKRINNQTVMQRNNGVVVTTILNL